MQSFPAGALGLAVDPVQREDELFSSVDRQFEAFPEHA